MLFCFDFGGCFVVVLFCFSFFVGFCFLFSLFFLCFLCVCVVVFLVRVCMRARMSIGFCFVAVGGGGRI